MSYPGFGKPGYDIVYCINPNLGDKMTYQFSINSGKKRAILKNAQKLSGTFRGRGTGGVPKII
jgi:hypothetical protein